MSTSAQYNYIVPCRLISRISMRTRADYSCSAMKIDIEDLNEY